MVRAPQAISRAAKACLDLGEVIVKRIDDTTRQAIAEAAHEVERDGWEVNRRALAREFGVSPQTVARIMDGPDAWRGSIGSGPLSSGYGWRRWLVGIGGCAAILWWFYRR